MMEDKLEQQIFTVEELELVNFVIFSASKFT